MGLNKKQDHQPAKHLSCFQKDAEGTYTFLQKALWTLPLLTTRFTVVTGLQDSLGKCAGITYSISEEQIKVARQRDFI